MKPKPGAFVRYVGSLTDQHGLYMLVGLCRCELLHRAPDSGGLYTCEEVGLWELVADGGRLQHVSPGSFAPTER